MTLGDLLDEWHDYEAANASPTVGRLIEALRDRVSELEHQVPSEGARLAQQRQLAIADHHIQELRLAVIRLGGHRHDLTDAYRTAVRRIRGVMMLAHPTFAESGIDLTAD